MTIGILSLFSSILPMLYYGLDGFTLSVTTLIGVILILSEAYRKERELFDIHFTGDK